MATPTKDADDSREAGGESPDGGSVRLEGEVISKRPTLSAALSLLPFHRRNGAELEGDLEPSDDG